MREIKFRAWDKKEKEMLLPNVHDGYLTDFRGKTFLIDWDSEETVEITRDIILMEYTGLKDKNGREIYEGDIVKNMEWVISPEAKDGSDASFGNRFEKDSPWIQKPRYREIKEREFFTDSEYGESPKDWEVIGNIYENPELLKGG